MDHHLKSACEQFIQQQSAQFVEPLEHFMAKVRATRPGGLESALGFLFRDRLSGGRSGRTRREARVSVTLSGRSPCFFLWKLLVLDFQIKTLLAEFLAFKRRVLVSQS